MKKQKNTDGFASEKELKDWLLNHKINFSLWDCNSAKSVQNLFKEIIEGDCFIQKEPPLRIINVVQVLVFREGLILTELEQEMDDFRRRKRNIPPSEKMKPGEDFRQAAIRCLQEELQISEDRITVLTKDCSPFVRYRHSRSYPGLRSKYHIFRVHADVNGLPDENFWSQEKVDGEDCHIVRRHLWGWTFSKKIKYPD